LSRYHAAIAWMDHVIAILLDNLRSRGILDNTIVIVTSDHGEQFGAHELNGHANSLYLPLIHVPLVVDSVESGVIPKDKADDLCILVGVFIHWQAEDNTKIYDFNYQATKESIQRALANKPSVDEVLAGAKTAQHPFSPK
jgi:hypothetical protein